MTRIHVEIFRESPLANLPARATAGAAGWDLTAAIEAPVTLQPGHRTILPTGLRAAIPHGWEMQIRPRSGLAAKHGVTVLNAPGTIDSDYRGPIGVILVNLGQAPVTIQPGDRIAQAILAPVPAIDIVEVAALSDLGNTERGAGGFGSTGLRSLAEASK